MEANHAISDSWFCGGIRLDCILKKCELYLHVITVRVMPAGNKSSQV